MQALHAALELHVREPVVFYLAYVPVAVIHVRLVIEPRTGIGPADAKARANIIVKLTVDLRKVDIDGLPPA